MADEFSKLTITDSAGNSYVYLGDGLFQTTLPDGATMRVDLKDRGPGHTFTITSSEPISSSEPRAADLPPVTG